MENLIKEKLRERKRSYGWLSLRTGLSRVYLCKLANDKVDRPSLQTAHKIARALHSTIDEIWKLESSTLDQEIAK